MPKRTLVSPFTEISIQLKEMVIKKLSYERRAYESVDEKSLAKDKSRKNAKKEEFAQWRVK